MNGTDPPVSLFWRVSWSVFALGILAGSIKWWLMMPHGFPLDHTRFWMNQVLPWAGVAMGAGLVFSAAIQLPRLFSVLVYLVPAVIFGSTAAMFALYPTSAQGVWYFGLVPGGLTWAAAWLAVRAVSVGAINITISLIAGVSLGLFMFGSQRGELPSTVPANILMPAVASGKQSSRTHFNFAPGVDVQPDLGRISAHAGALRLSIYPWINFDSRSADRFWVLFSPSKMLLPPDRWLASSISGPDGAWLKFAGSEPAVIHLPQSQDSNRIAINAYTDIASPVYSHVNTYAHVDVIGHRRLKLVFSPVPGKPVEVMPADYPYGRPLRFAYLGADGIFRIVEASSGEKGPFREIGSGPLMRGAPLSVTLLDNGRPAARIVLQDWSSQLSTALSPTAGWGVPVNGIEFSRASDKPESSVNIYITLASTSIGLGFDTVGHKPGKYANRMQIERF